MDDYRTGGWGEALLLRREFPPYSDMNRYSAAIFPILAICAIFMTGLDAVVWAVVMSLLGLATFFYHDDHSRFWAEEDTRAMGWVFAATIASLFFRHDVGFLQWLLISLAQFGAAYVGGILFVKEKKRFKVVTITAAALLSLDAILLYGNFLPLLCFAVAGAAWQFDKMAAKRLNYLLPQVWSDGRWTWAEKPPMWVKIAAHCGHSWAHIGAALAMFFAFTRLG